MVLWAVSVGVLGLPLFVGLILSDFSFGSPTFLAALAGWGAFVAVGPVISIALRPERSDRLRSRTVEQDSRDKGGAG